MAHGQTVSGIGQRRLWFVAVALLGSGCGFSPRVPDGTIVCNQDRDCPAGLICTPGTDGTASLCCRGGICPARVGGGQGTLPPAGSVMPLADAGPDLGPPPADAGDAPAPPDAGGASAPLTCTPGARTPPVAGPNRRLACAIHVGQQTSAVGIEIITGNNPVSSATHGVCQAPLSLAAPISAATIDALVATLQQLAQVCTQAGAMPVGSVAGSWARQAPNRADILARVRAQAQLALEVPDEAQEVEHRYRGAARNRRGRIVLDDGQAAPEILVWPEGAAAPTRHVLPVSFAEVGTMYLAPTTYGSFEQARLALRNRMNQGMLPLWQELAGLVGADEVLATVAVGPATSATVPLAVKGMLRDAAAGWFDPPRYQARLAALQPSASPYGATLGIVTPAEIDAFFPSITAREFMQLRSEPIRSAYGERVVLTTVLLDLLGDEVETTEFGFTATQPYLGFLFSKLYPEME